MTKIECVNCDKLHRVDSVYGQPEDKHAKVTYTCSENGVKYGANRLMRELEDVNQEGDELVS